MILGLGNDIVEIERIAAVLARQGDAFARRILTPTEFEQWQQTKMPERFLAKRFAAKEAASKALGTGIAQGVSFQDFEIQHDSLGKPELFLTGKAAQLAQARAVARLLVSLSDEKHYALATVILES